MPSTLTGTPTKSSIHFGRDKVIALNLTAPTMITKRAVNHMVKHEIKGAIVNSE
jgi:short-subunit dehydrogenase